MRYREIGATGVKVSEVGFGGEWVDKANLAKTRALFDRCEQAGVNVVDCWMADPDMRSAIGFGLQGRRDRWVIQGHIGSTWQNGQYVRTREMSAVVPAFEDLLARLGTDRIEFGMLHFVDTDEDYDVVMGLAAPASAPSAPTSASAAASGQAAGSELHRPALDGISVGSPERVFETVEPLVSCLQVLASGTIDEGRATWRLMLGNRVEVEGITEGFTLAPHALFSTNIALPAPVAATSFAVSFSSGQGWNSNAPEPSPRTYAPGISDADNPRFRIVVANPSGQSYGDCAVGWSFAGTVDEAGAAAFEASS